MEEKIKDCVSVDEKPEDAIDAMKKFTGDMSLEPIGIDDSFGFKCQQCGQCCMHRNDIILNPFDVYNGARYLGITPEEFVSKYAHVDLGANSKIPMVLLKSGDNGFCPLLKLDVKDGGKFKCIIHAAKPGACSNHPIGVAYSKNVETGESTTQYVKVQQCQNSISDEMQLVRDWVKPYTDHQDEINVAHEIQHMVTRYFNPRKFWMTAQILRKLPDVLQVREDSLIQDAGIELLRAFITNTVGYGYMEYDISKPFIPQAEENMKKLDDFYSKTKELFDQIKPCIDAVSSDLAEGFEEFLMKKYADGDKENTEGDDSNVNS
jgi:Fe-S-cluster containining protein